MFTRSRFVALLTLGIGVTLGYAAASGKLNPFPRSDAAPTGESANPATCQPGDGTCCADAERARLLAAANSNVNATLQPKDGKKPNIVVIMGDDVGIWNI